MHKCRLCIELYNPSIDRCLYNSKRIHRDFSYPSIHRNGREKKKIMNGANEDIQEKEGKEGLRNMYRCGVVTLRTLVYKRAMERKERLRLR